MGETGWTAETRTGNRIDTSPTDPSHPSLSVDHGERGYSHRGHLDLPDCVDWTPEGSRSERRMTGGEIQGMSETNEIPAISVVRTQIERPS